MLHAESNVKFLSQKEDQASSHSVRFWRMLPKSLHSGTMNWIQMNDGAVLVHSFHRWRKLYGIRKIKMKSHIRELAPWRLSNIGTSSSVDRGHESQFGFKNCDPQVPGTRWSTDNERAANKGNKPTGLTGRPPIGHPIIIMIIIDHNQSAAQ